MRNGEPKYRRRIREKTDENKHEAEAKERETKEERRIGDLTAAIQRVEQELNRANNERTPEKKRDRLWERFGVVGLWAAAAVGVTAIWIASYEAGKQRRIAERQMITMRGQLEEMRNQRLQTMAQTRANLKREQSHVNALNEKGDTASIGEKLAGWAISPVWTNAGSTDAREYRNWFEFKVFDRPNGKLIDDEDCPTLIAPSPLPRAIVVISGQKLTELARNLSLAEAVAMQQGKKYILMWGHIEYKDIYFPVTTAHFVKRQ
jgi:hypothetical protein